MKINLAFIFLTLSLQFATGQHYKNYSWSETPLYENPSADFPGKSTVGLTKVVIVEFSGSALDVFETHHEKLFVADEKGVRENNKVYIPMSRGTSLVDIKARTISKEGEVSILDRNNIKEVQNVDEYGDFKIFAIEGSTPESIIEVLYTLKGPYYPFGWETIQEDYPLKKAKFTLVHGNNTARVKAYQTPEQVKSTVMEGKEAKTFDLTDIPAMIEEDFATPNSNKISVAYQCFGAGRGVPDSRIWGNVAGNICSDVFTTKISKIVPKDIRNMTSDDNSSTFRKALWVDNFIKSEFTVSRRGSSEYEDADAVIKNRVGSPTGILKAYGQYLTELGIEFEVVLTANRYIHNFDPYFFTPRAIQDFLIYLPEIKKYIAPDRIEYRLGEAPFNMLGNGAVFVRNNISFYPGMIKQADPDFSRIKRITDISFEDNMSNVILDQYQEYYGHWSVTNRAVLSFSSESDIDGFEDYLTGSGIEDKKTLTYTLENDQISNDEYNLPFIVNSKISSELMIEDAGDSYIFLVGMAIGTQSELYQEEDRVNPILSRYPNVYNYTITVDIPAGYKAEGLEELEIYKELKKEDRIICKFESGYELVDDKIIITIEEFYKEIDIPVSEYTDFRNVINAASDFNKASILFSKETD